MNTLGVKGSYKLVQEVGKQLGKEGVKFVNDFINSDINGRAEKIGTICGNIASGKLVVSGIGKVKVLADKVSIAKIGKAAEAIYKENALKKGGLKAGFLLKSALKTPVVGKVGKGASKVGKGASKVGKVSSKGVTFPKNVIKNTESFIKDAIKTDRNGLSKLGRGLQKHSSRKNSPFYGIKFSHKNANKVGEKVLRDILNSNSKITKHHPNGTKSIFDKITGRGVNISRDGLFNGFRDLNKN